MKAELTKEQWAELLATKSKQELCQELGISSRTLYRRMNGMGLTDPNYGPKGLTDADKTEIFRLSKSGAKQQEIAVRFGVSQSLVSRVLRQDAQKKGVSSEKTEPPSSTPNCGPI